MRDDYLLASIRRVDFFGVPETLRLERSVAGNWSAYYRGRWRRTKCTNLLNAIVWARDHLGITITAALGDKGAE